MEKKKANQVTIVVDNKNSEQGNLLKGLITEKKYKVNIISPSEFEQNAKISSTNKVIYLAPSKQYDNRVNITPKIYTEYGMQYGWLANDCIIGVDAKKVNFKDKEKIVNLFPEMKEYSFKTKKQKKDKTKDKNKNNEKNKGILGSIFNMVRFGSSTPKYGWPFIARTPSLLTLSGVSAYLGYKGFKGYKNKKDLIYDMEMYNIYNFVKTDIDSFMEIE